MTIVIIGAGIAGVTCAEEIKKLRPEQEVILLGAEPHDLYSRVLLPHFLKGKVPRERVFLKKPEWYSEKGIEYRSGVMATAIDTMNKFVATDDGREVAYDKLILTTGGDVRHLPDDRRGVSYFRGLDDADHLLKLINEVQTLPEDQRNAVVYGGGFITMEYVNLFAHYGISCQVMMRSQGFWSKQLSLESSDVLVQHAKSQGVDVRTDITDVELIGEKELEAVRVQGEDISTRILGVGIGIQSDRQLIESAGIKMQIGILTNAYLETNVQDVYAAGDVAEFEDVVIGRQMVHGNWMNALQQGRYLAKRIVNGEDKAFELVSSYATNLLGKEIVFIGDTSRAHADEARQLLLTDDAAMEIFDRDGKTVGAILIEDVTHRQAITAAIRAKEQFTI